MPIPFRFKQAAAVMTFVLMCAMVTTAVADDRFKGPDGSYANPALAYGMSAPVSYYAIFGEWPGSWTDVTEAGLVQVALRNSDGELVNMDDNSLDFPGDVHYIPGGGGEPPKLALKSGSTVRIIALLPFSNSYDALIESQGPGFTYSELLGDKKAQRLLGMQAMLYQSFHLFSVLEGRMPRNWQELLESGVAPFDASSTSPVTGEVLRFDGSEYDFDFRFVEQYDAPVVNAMGGAGEFLWQGSVF